MTFERPGTGGYPPQPPPSNSNRKILLGVLFGCLGLIAVGLLVGGILVYRTFSGFKQAMQQPAPPVNATALQKQFAGVPIYPGAKLNVQATQELSRVTRAMQSMPMIPKGMLGSMPIAAFDAPGTTQAVAQWYDQTMPSRGWAAQQRPATQSRGAHRAFQKGNSTLMVQAMEGKNGRTHLQMFLITIQAPGANPRRSP